ncbi:uncharacterized protein LOC129909954 [Episyrphus balteatus]|uniref:uncharacterized protein LOC129909954 n=1 Tax=Episyrphus balteatus TaxID=286459 RepID=UPI0024868072|nr:uncharacterized protein LOC129909954 [Episyrphus balteatus]
MVAGNGLHNLMNQAFKYQDAVLIKRIQNLSPHKNLQHIMFIDYVRFGPHQITVNKKPKFLHVSEITKAGRYNTKVNHELVTTVFVKDVVSAEQCWMNTNLIPWQYASTTKIFLDHRLQQVTLDSNARRTSLEFGATQSALELTTNLM